MAKTKNIGLKVGIVLALILAITVSTMVYLFFNHTFGNSHGDMVIDYNRLKPLTASDMFYLSQDFALDNNLQIKPIYQNYEYDQDGKMIAGGTKLGEVVLEYDKNKVSKDDYRLIIDISYVAKHVKHIDLYKYELVSADKDGIPVRVSVVGAQGVNKKHKYNQSYGDVKYAILNNELTTYYTGIGKSYELKAQVGKSGAIKKYARLKITVPVDAEIASVYSSESIEREVDELLDSALNYVEFFA